MKTFYTMKEFFSYINWYKEELFVRKNVAYNKTGEEVAIYIINKKNK